MSERLRRWRLVLGTPAEDACSVTLEAADQGRDQTLTQLYDQDRGAGMGRSSPKVARWLGDIRTYFPSSVVQVMQRDAMERLGLRALLLEPEMLAAVQPDMDLVATIVSLNQVIPEHSRQTARQVVRTVTAALQQRLKQKTRQAVLGALHRAARTNRPRAGDIDWNRTIAKNLRHYQPEYKTVIPDRLIGYRRNSSHVAKDLILAIDQSGSMATSVVYASVFGAVLASLPTLRTHLVAFDTAVVDLTELCDDPVDVLFGVQLGGGTDIDQAIAFCQTLVTRPAETIVVLISDLYEGGDKDSLLQRIRALTDSGVTVVALLALNDVGAPFFDAEVAAQFTALGAPAFACTPDLFPDLMAAAIDGRDLVGWAGRNEISVG